MQLVEIWKILDLVPKIGALGKHWAETHKALRGAGNQEVLFYKQVKWDWEPQGVRARQHGGICWSHMQERTSVCILGGGGKLGDITGLCGEQVLRKWLKCWHAISLRGQASFLCECNSLRPFRKERVFRLPCLHRQAHSLGHRKQRVKLPEGVGQLLPSQRIIDSCSIFSDNSFLWLLGICLFIYLFSELKLTLYLDSTLDHGLMHLSSSTSFLLTVLISAPPQPLSLYYSPF